MLIPAAKEFEKPEAGMHLGVIVDVVDLGVISTVFEGKQRNYPALQIIWSLATLGKDGKPLQVRSRKLNMSSWNEKGNLFKTVKQILGAPPAVTFDPESLVGQVRQLVINREKSVDGTKDYANIIGILPAQSGLSIPADYIRVKYRPQTQAGPQGQPVQTYQQSPQQVQATQQYNPPVPALVQQHAPQTYPTPVPQGADVRF